MTVVWKDEFATGIKEVDEQHKRLIEICASAFEVAELEDGIDHYDQIVAILGELTDYTDYHFTSEEKLMEKVAYPDIDQHKIEHLFFMKKIKKIDLQAIDKDQHQAIIDILNMLVDWVANHILVTDMMYVESFKAKGL